MKKSAVTDTVIESIRSRLKTEFPDETVYVKLSGIRNNIHVLVVSEKLDKFTDAQKTEFVWGLIQDCGLSDQELSRISLLLPYSPAQLV